MSPILPGSTIGSLGGGQLGRMTAMAARSLGYRVQVLDPDPSCPARFVVDACFEASWDDAAQAANLARGCDVVTLEIEQVSIASLNAAAKYAPVRPNAAVLEIVQDRIRQKQWLEKQGMPLGSWRPVLKEEDLQRATQDFGRVFLKSAHGGYDGRSQAKIGFTANPREAEAVQAWQSLGQRPCVAEQALSLEMEISVMVARRPSGQMLAFPPARNHHENQILAWSVIPAILPPELHSKASEIAIAIASAFQLEGLMAVEMFVTTDGDLLVNELAPRPHNSYHASERACVTSQFEQAVRAICDLPLGQVDLVRPAAIVNLLGDVWLKEHPPQFDRALAIPGVDVHLYEKHVPRPGRKMGHLSALADTPEEAVKRVLEAKKVL